MASESAAQACPSLAMTAVQFMMQKESMGLWAALWKSLHMNRAADS